ncbi:MAG: Serine/threonine-protein kinase Pkn1 [Chlamydiales bacterium]|nr:Serine/threonine-protein kinase Pkn1 [Chlamydiales bacterium]MCH9620116.1 Serine/threonine-protein kinase Pkn1 [Chlamydiales bacterium]MCH9623586.1 Serine/threonine-protein kinase Pkn1 [Chlamydiales bacterium]
MTSIPELLGDYRVLKQMGQGPLGKLYLAEHRFIKRQYLLKVLPEELTQDRTFLQQFEEEVLKLATLDHPHLVKVHNVSFAEGHYFLVTDCVVDSIGETTNLAQYMAGRKERLREEELLSVLKQIATALDYIHEKGVSHLSLKLNNILVGKGKPGIDIFLSDIALAKMINPAAVVSRTYKVTADALEAFPVEVMKGGEERYLSHPIKAEKVTKLTTSFLQNFAFLAPEQKRHEKPGPAADVYAFGVLAYYLISGQFPEAIFPMPSKIASGYQYDWDSLVDQCLKYEADLRPLKVGPLLEKEKKEAPLLRPVVEEKREETPSLRPVVEEKREETPSLRPVVEEKREETPPVQILKEKLMTKIKQPALAPVINRGSVEPPPQPEAAVSVAPSFVEKKDLSEATAVPFTPVESSVRETMKGRDPVVKEYRPEHSEHLSIEPIETEMVAISGGAYMRGSNEGNRDEAPCHQIQIENFAIDIHSVTNEQFVRFLEYMGGEKDQNYNDLIRLKDSRVTRTAGKLSIESGYAKHPVVGVTWYGAVAYAKWVGKRLPTEAEWEVVAAGGMENPPYPTGQTIEKNQANFFSSDTTPVMSYAANPYGIYDIVGNVYEWCQDWYGYNYFETTAQEPLNPKGPIQGVYRVLRGGCWKSLKEDLRCSHRHRNNPGTVNGTCGFRCAADVQQV